MALDVVEDTLVSAHTHPDLVTTMILALENDIDHKQDHFMQHADAPVTELIQQQQDIGWHLVKYGRIIQLVLLSTYSSSFTPSSRL